jgi:hypothetical protein
MILDALLCLLGINFRVRDKYGVGQDLEVGISGTAR